MVWTIPQTHNCTVKQYRRQVWTQYIRAMFWSKFFGTSDNAVIQVNKDLAKAAGDSIQVVIRAKLKGTSRTEGDDTLKGNEEEMVFKDQRIIVDEIRWGTARKGKLSQKRVLFDLRNQAKGALQDLAQEETDRDITTAMVATPAGSDRILYGNAVSNTALSDIDNTDDKCTADGLRRVKRLLKKKCNPRIRPAKMKNGDELFIAVLDTYAVRDLKADTGTTGWAAIQMAAQVRGGKNPMFTGALGMIENLVLYEYENLPILSGVGAGSIDVAQNLILGAQAAAVVWGQMTDYSEDLDDYGHRHGFSIDEIRNVEKLKFDFDDTSKDHGVFTWYTAGVEDT